MPLKGHLMARSQMPDRTIIGDPQPRYSLVWNLGAEWNNFDFNVFYKGVAKRDIL